MAIKILIILFTVFALSRVFLRFREKHVTLIEFLLWSVLWIGIAVAAVLPQTTTIIADMLGVGRGVDAVIYLALLVLFYGMFRLYVKMEHIEREITQIVRRVALRGDVEISEATDERKKKSINR
ncbi:MAG: DUF2304 family protein [Patescibacteria group bacterium]